MQRLHANAPDPRLESAESPLQIPAVTRGLCGLWGRDERFFMIIIFLRNVFAFSFCTILSLAGEGAAVGRGGVTRDSREYDKSAI